MKQNGFLEFEVPSDSEANFCGSDNDNIENGIDSDGDQIEHENI